MVTSNYNDSTMITINIIHSLFWEYGEGWWRYIY